jgi:beta-lactamase superfamily II metal-dependent hydrolase
MKRINFIIIFLLFFSLFTFGNKLRVYFVDVGQGDGSLIITPSGKTIVIDCNTGYGEETLKILNENGYSNTIDYMIATHYHEDHIGGLDEIINGAGAYTGVDVIYGCYDRGESYSSIIVYPDYLNAITTTTGGRKTVTLGETIDLGAGVTMKFLTLNGSVFNSGGSISTTNENELGVSVLISYKEFDLFIGGDIEDGMEAILGDDLGDIDVYQVDHHGSNTSSTSDFLGYITPEVSIISVGNNTYGHPTQEVIDRIHNVGSYIYQTETGDGGTLGVGWGEIANDNILLETDGCSYTVSGGALTTKAYPCDIPCEEDPPIFSGLKNIQDTHNGGDVVLSWDSANDTAGSYPMTYNIYQANSSMGYNFEVPDHTTESNTSYTVMGLTPDTTYYFLVRAEDVLGNEDSNSVEMSIAPSQDISPPDFDGLRSAGLTGNPGETFLQWDAAHDNSPPITYNIYRSTTSGGEDFANPTISGLTTLSYIDKDLVDGPRYYYVVRAMDADSREEKNNVERSAIPNGDTTPPSFAGVGAIFTVDAPDELLLVWNKATDNVDENITYNVYRSILPGDEDLLNPVGSTTALKYYDSELATGITYYYIVRAEDESNNEDTNNVEKFCYLKIGKVVTPPVLVYPNPIATKNGASEIRIKWALDIEDFDIYTISGNSIVTKSAIVYRDKNNITYKTSRLRSGIYIVTVTCNAQHSISKFAVIN